MLTSDNVWGASYRQNRLSGITEHALRANNFETVQLDTYHALKSKITVILSDDGDSYCLGRLRAAKSSGRHYTSGKTC
jgi:hypothetical protein